MFYVLSALWKGFFCCLLIAFCTSCKDSTESKEEGETTTAEKNDPQLQVSPTPQIGVIDPAIESQLGTMNLSQEEFVSVCNRTEEVQQVIMSIFSSTDCSKLTVQQLASIQELNLYKKGISSLKPDDFQYMLSLKKLFLTDNDLQILPNQLLRHMPNLEVLSMSFNEIETLPQDQMFQHMSRLEVLALSGNLLEVLHENTFSGLSSLRKLYLTDNELQDMHELTFQHLASLEELYLNRNHINDLTFLKPADHAGLGLILPSLKVLDLSNNEIESLEMSLITSMRLTEHLTTIDLSRNEFSWGEKRKIRFTLRERLTGI